jgi:tripartite-type tricarboxylate transporter receptor subunit TctC
LSVLNGYPVFARSRSLWIFGLFFLLAAVGSSALAQTAPLRIVVGFPPGGGADAFARAVAERLKETMNRTVVVENRPGAGGVIAAQQVKAMAGDTNVVLMGSDHQFVLAPLTLKSLDTSRKTLLLLANSRLFVWL